MLTTSALFERLFEVYRAAPTWWREHPHTVDDVEPETRYTSRSSSAAIVNAVFADGTEQ